MTTNNSLNFSDVSLESFEPLTNWTPAKEIKESVYIQLGLENPLTARQWNKFREERDLETANIKGVWHVRYTQEVDTVIDGEEYEQPDEPVTPKAVAPNVVTFGDFSSSLAVVNNVASQDIQVHNTTFNTHALATQADTFTSQLGAFTAFLDNTDKMLQQRKQELEEQTRIKREALHTTQLQVENIRQRALLAQRETIATKVMNESLDAQMQETVETGKHLYNTLNSLSE
jgi:hypothetical protein